VRKLSSLLGLVFVALLLAAAGARAASPTMPRPKPGSLALHLPGGFVVNNQVVTIANRGIYVAGIVQPYVPDQSVTLRAYLGRRLIRSVHLVIFKRNGHGRFSQQLSIPRPGDVTVMVSHARTTEQLGFQARRRFAVLDKNIHFGSLGRFVELVQERLAALHFFIPRSGVYDDGTGLAIDAYHRLLGWGTSHNLDSRTISFLLNGWGAFKVRYPGHGRHAEGDLGKQLLALIDGSNVYWIFPISSGKPSTPTVLGNFHIYRRVPGYRPDGMYFSSYFTGGYAIHGFNPAPDYPASHGCMRLPIADAIPAYNWLNFGDAVDVYQ
jgi:hypothetical protein